VKLLSFDGSLFYWDKEFLAAIDMLAAISASWQIGSYCYSYYIKSCPRDWFFKLKTCKSAIQIDFLDRNFRSCGVVHVIDLAWGRRACFDEIGSGLVEKEPDCVPGHRPLMSRRTRWETPIGRYDEHNLVSREIDDIGGFKAKTELACAGQL
jgi:hypothetical protein